VPRFFGILSRLPRPLAIGLFATACRSGGSGASSAPVPAVTDTVFYASARARVNGRDSRRLSDSLEYGFVVSRVTPGPDALLDPIDVQVVDSVRLSQSAFADALRAHRDSTGAPVVLLVHGFGTSLHEAWEYVSHARVRSRSRVPWVVFCWPSNGAGLSWARPSEILVRAYRDDLTSAAASRSAFSQALRVMLPAVGGDRLIVLAHSMGAQLMGDAMVADTALRESLRRDPVRAIAFLAPDVATQRFSEVVLPAVLPLSRRVVVYLSSGDRLLQISRVINGNDRAGLIRGYVPSFQGVEVVDMTEGETAENSVQRMVGTHHAIKRASAALFDLQIVAGGYTPDCRALLKTASLGQGNVWKLTRAKLPPLSALASCERERSE